MKLVCKIKGAIPNKYKEKIKKTMKLRQYIKYEKLCKKTQQKQHIIFGTPIHGNLGDHAIAMAEYEMMKKQGKELFEIATYEEEKCFEEIAKRIPKNAVILITGGGSMGSQWKREEDFFRKIIKQFHENKIIVFPQTIYYKQDENGKKELEIAKKIYNKHENLTICARETVSYEKMKEIFPNAKIIFVPDIVLSLDTFKTNKSRSGALVCLRSDPESNLGQNEKEKIINIVKQKFDNVSLTDTVVNKAIKQVNRIKEVQNKLEEFSSAKLVVTDRLHGMIFAAITQTPCVTFGNYNHKVKGVYEWIRNLPFIEYIDSIEDLETNIEKVLKEQNVIWNKELQKNFEPLVNILKKS